jgi:hypothetical protein
MKLILGQINATTMASTHRLIEERGQGEDIATAVTIITRDTEMPSLSSRNFDVCGTRMFTTTSVPSKFGIKGRC